MWPLGRYAGGSTGRPAGPVGGFPAQAAATRTTNLAAAMCFIGVPRSVTRILVQVGVGHELGRGERIKVQIRSRRRPSQGAALPRPEVGGAGEPPVADQVSPPVRFPQQL